MSAQETNAQPEGGAAQAGNNLGMTNEQMQASLL